MIDYQIDKCRSRDEVKVILESYMDYYNKQRPCFAIGYDTPVGYRKRYYKGELDRKETFSNRELSELPKFICVLQKISLILHMDEMKNIEWYDIKT